ncbi:MULTISPECIES: hypothetical protein [unclassified Nocardia]|nr:MULTISPECIES: hypothetical protein [unclassified Nocardia]
MAETRTAPRREIVPPPASPTRPLDEIYVAIFIDAIVVKARGLAQTS